MQGTRFDGRQLFLNPEARSLEVRRGAQTRTYKLMTDQIYRITPPFALTVLGYDGCTILNRGNDFWVMKEKGQPVAIGEVSIKIRRLGNNVLHVDANTVRFFPIDWKNKMCLSSNYSLPLGDAEERGII